MNDVSAFWAVALRRVWGLDARLSRLDGEYDLNFLVQATNGQDYVLKVMRAGCDLQLVDLQIKALEHIAAEAPGLPFPKVIPGLDGGLGSFLGEGSTQRKHAPGIRLAHRSNHPIEK